MDRNTNRPEPAPDVPAAATPDKHINFMQAEGTETPRSRDEDRQNKGQGERWQSGLDAGNENGNHDRQQENDHRSGQSDHTAPDQNTAGIP